MIINLLTLIVFFVDKYLAIMNRWRVSEKALWLLALLGGSLGGLAAMQLARHKRRKPGFVLIMVVILLVQIIIIYFWWQNNYYNY